VRPLASVDAGFFEMQSGVIACQPVSLVRAELPLHILLGLMQDVVTR